MGKKPNEERSERTPHANGRKRHDRKAGGESRPRNDSAKGNGMDDKKKDDEEE